MNLYQVAISFAKSAESFRAAAEEIVPSGEPHPTAYALTHVGSLMSAAAMCAAIAQAVLAGLNVEEKP